MSLKAVHIFFIALSAVLCFAIGIARAQAFADSGGSAALVQSVASILAGGTLVEYGRRFLKKTKNLGYL